MNGNFIRQLALFSIALCVLAACASQTVAVQTTPPLLVTDTTTPGPTSTPTATLTPAPTYTASATPCLGLVATPVSTPAINPAYRWPYGEATIPRIPIQGMECAAPEEIVRQLMLQWLETIKTNSLGQRCGLEDYKLGTITIKDTTAPQYDTMAVVGYHVKPGRFGDCGWISDRGEIEKDGWIKTEDFFGVYREKGYFKLVAIPLSVFAPDV